MNEDRKGAPVDLLPDRREQRVGERPAGDVRQHHHAHRAPVETIARAPDAAASGYSHGSEQSQRMRDG